MEDSSVFLWQRAIFSAGENSRSEVDSLRLRTSLLEQAHQEDTQAVSHGKRQLLRTAMRQYGNLVDCQDLHSGMNNFAGPIEVLTTNAKNESREWKSQLSFKSVTNMTEIQSLLSTVKQPSCVESLPRPAQLAVNQSATTLPQTHHRQSSSRGHRSAGSSSSTVSSRSNAFEWQTTGPRKKKARIEEEEEESGGRDNVGKPNAFVTARDQYIINQSKKHTKRPAGGSRSNICDTDEYKARSTVTSTSYGASKRSLGTRRGVGSKFVPPVKQDNQEEGVVEQISSKVHRSKSSGEGTSQLPPELEGDDRLKNIEPRMVELIMNEIMDHGAPVQWNDIAGLEFAKATITEIAVWPMTRPDLFTGLRGPPKGILLFGPPGTGKTLIGKCVASQVAATFFSISASSLTSKWVGEGEKMVRALFAVARCYQPAVIFIDEIDSLLSQRSDSEHESSRRIKTEFLVQLDGATTSADDRLLVIGATNRPQEIDEAARRRLVKRLYIPLPDCPARRQLISNLSRQQPFSLTEEEMESVCQQSEGYSGADVTNLCREAALGPIREAAGNIQHITASEVRAVNYPDFQDAFQVIRPSVSQEDLGVYVDWNARYGCGVRK